jgi:pimeloyl-ACP methyl ester carboxylesterase
LAGCTATAGRTAWPARGRPTEPTSRHNTTPVPYRTVRYRAGELIFCARCSTALQDLTDQAETRSFADSFTAPGSTLATSEFVSDILATDGAARAGLGSSVGEGRFADEVAIVGELRQPLAILHGTDEQLVNLDYLRKLTIPAPWRGEVQLIPGAGHAPHQETPQQFAALLTDFIGDLRG